jgi:hypothetical protein
MGGWQKAAGVYQQAGPAGQCVLQQDIEQVQAISQMIRPVTKA